MPLSRPSCNISEPCRLQSSAASILHLLCAQCSHRHHASLALSRGALYALIEAIWEGGRTELEQLTRSKEEAERKALDSEKALEEEKV